MLVFFHLILTISNSITRLVFGFKSKLDILSWLLNHVYFCPWLPLITDFKKNGFSYIITGFFIIILKSKTQLRYAYRNTDCRKYVCSMLVRRIKWLSNSKTLYFSEWVKFEKVHARYFLNIFVKYFFRDKWVLHRSIERTFFEDSKFLWHLFSVISSYIRMPRRSLRLRVIYIISHEFPIKLN